MRPTLTCLCFEAIRYSTKVALSHGFKLSTGAFIGHLSVCPVTAYMMYNGYDNPLSQEFIRGFIATWDKRGVTATRGVTDYDIGTQVGAALRRYYFGPKEN